MKIFDLFKKKEEFPMVQLEVVGEVKFDTKYENHNRYTFDFYDRMDVSYNVHVSTKSDNLETLTFQLDGDFSIDYSYEYSDHSKKREKRKEMHDDILKFFIAKGESGVVRERLEKDIIKELKRKIAENKIDDFKKLIDGKSFSVNISFECNKDDLELK
ncbi:hypothetical protein [Bacillus stercoris]|uniref:hypothetical protein n=1 Tax=Bacillus stercoris TaxID=2054641 RepID=UPI003CF7BE7D